MPGAAVAGAAYTAGLGGFSRWVAEQRLRQQQLAQQDMMQQRALGAQMFGQQQNLQAQLARDFAQQNFQAQRDVFGAQQRADADNQQAANDAEWRNAQLKQQRELAGDRGAMDAVQENRLWAASTMQAIQDAQKQGYNVNKLEYDKAYGAYQEILKDPSLSVNERRDAVENQRRKIEGVIMSAKPSMDGPPQTKEQRLNENVVTIPVNPEVPDSGKSVWLQQPSRNGQPPTYKLSHFEFPDGTISKDGVHPRQAELDKQTLAEDKLFQELLTFQKETTDAEGGTKKDFLSSEEINERLEIARARKAGAPLPPTPKPPLSQQAPVAPPIPAQPAVPQTQANVPPPVPPDLLAKQSVAQVTSDAEYNALPSGTQYLAPDGTIRTKR